MSKQERERLRSLSFTEKIKILEKLRDRSLAIGKAGLRKKHQGPSSAPDARDDKSQS